MHELCSELQQQQNPSHSAAARFLAFFFLETFSFTKINLPQLSRHRATTARADPMPKATVAAPDGRLPWGQAHVPRGTPLP